MAKNKIISEEPPVKEQYKKRYDTRKTALLSDYVKGNLSFLVVLTVLYGLDFTVEFITASIGTQLRTVENNSDQFDEIQFYLQILTVSIFILSIIACIFAGLVDNYSIVFYTTLAGLGFLIFDAGFTGISNAPFANIDYNIQPIILYISLFLNNLNIIFKPIRTVLILQHFILPDHINRLLLGIAILMILRNLALVIDTLNTSYLKEPWTLLIFDTVLILVLITFIPFLVCFRNNFWSTSQVAFKKIIKCYFTAIKLTLKPIDNITANKWTDVATNYTEEERETTRLTASIMLILSTFAILSALIQMIYDAYNYQVEINSKYRWISELRAESIVAIANILNISIFIGIGLLIKNKFTLITFDLRKVKASFIFILLGACFMIYAQIEISVHAIILPPVSKNGQMLQITLYNMMNSSVYLSSEWTNNFTMDPLTATSYYVRMLQNTQAHTLMTITNEEGFEMRDEKQKNELNSKTTYTKTIFAKSLEPTSYIISDLGLVQTSSYGYSEQAYFKSIKKQVAQVAILSTMNWYYFPLQLQINDEEICIDIPNVEKKQFIGLKQGKYDYSVLFKNKTIYFNASLKIPGYSNYTIIFYEDDEKIQTLLFDAPTPKYVRRKFRSGVFHFISLYFVSLGISIIMIWLTRFIYSESPISSRCFLFAFFGFMWILGPSVYYFMLYIWRNSTYMNVMIITGAICVFDFAGFIVTSILYDPKTPVVKEKPINVG